MLKVAPIASKGEILNPNLFFLTSVGTMFLCKRCRLADRIMAVFSLCHYVGFRVSFSFCIGGKTKYNGGVWGRGVGTMWVYLFIYMALFVMIEL